MGIEPLPKTREQMQFVMKVAQNPAQSVNGMTLLKLTCGSLFSHGQSYRLTSRPTFWP